MAGATDDPLVNVSITPGGLQVVELRRHKALNAVNIGAQPLADMVRQIHSAVTATSSHSAVLIQSPSDRAFCSGGDIKAIRQAALDAPFSGVAPRGHKVRDVFLAEYRLVAALAALERPAIAICHGVWMGFGVGLAGWLPVRVVTERTVFAMPECSIGLFPDVSFALMAANRMPLSMALYLALTGARITCPADLLQMRLGTHFVPSDRLETLRAELKECTFSADSASEELRKCVEAHAQDAPPTGAQSVAAHLDVIEDAMRPGVEAMRSGRGCVEAVRAVKAQVDGLMEQTGEAEEHQTFVGLMHEALAKASPQSLALTMQHVFDVHRDAHVATSEFGVQGCLVRELAPRVAGARAHLLPARALALHGKPPVQLLVGPVAEGHSMQAATRITGQHDFLEGVRAAVVDKDRCPRWRPDRIDGVNAESVAALLECPDELRQALLA